MDWKDEGQKKGYCLCDIWFYNRAHSRVYLQLLSRHQENKVRLFVELEKGIVTGGKLKCYGEEMASSGTTDQTSRSEGCGEPWRMGRHYECLAAGKPILGAPFGADQPKNIETIVKKRIGLALFQPPPLSLTFGKPVIPKDLFEPELLGQKLDELINNPIYK